MTRAREKEFIIISILIIAAVLASVFCFAAVSPLSAIGTDPVILAPDSKFAVGGDYVAYTCEGSLSIIDMSYNYSPITKRDAYVGEVLSIAMSADNIALLTQKDGVRKVTVFPYSADGIGDGVNETFNSGDEYATKEGLKQLYYKDSLLCGLARSEAVNQDGYKRFNKKDDVYVGASDFILSLDSETLHFASGRYIKSADNISYNEIVNYNSTPFPTDVKQIFLIDGVMTVNTQDGIYYESEGGSFVKITDEVYTYVTGGQAEYSDGYIYIFDAQLCSIKRYTVIKDEDGYKLKYNKSYDTERYAHPTEFTMMAGIAAISEAGVTLYRSPRDLEVVDTGVIYAFALQDTQDGYYYCVNDKGARGYAEKSAVRVLNKSEVGYEYGQPLHTLIDTPVYAYPYDGAPIIANMRPDSSGAVICKLPDGSEIYNSALIMKDNVAEDGGKPIWDRYSVVIKTNDGEISGYVDSRAVCPYTSYIPPSTNKSCRVDAKRAGIKIKMYSAPDEKAECIFELSDNTELMLADGYSEGSEWTAVIYKDKKGYVKTENIIVSGLTQLRIILIVVLCVLGAAIASISAVLAIKRKKRKEGHEEE
ncbi:MAG: hypothetical protein K2M44_03815 [Clostridia bacterium]|nr:hypothetical protein [Clostridia bacterium]